MVKTVGLFFICFLTTLPALRPKAVTLSAPAQIYFRHFVEVFTPLVVSNEKRGSSAKNFHWSAKNRDCAGLVRYVFREALSKQTPAFLNQYPELNRVAPPQDWEEFNHALETWQMKNNTAAELVRHARFIGKTVSREKVETGDLLYFESTRLKIRHVMLVVRTHSEVFLVYHTGDKRDELRIRTVADILKNNDAYWHPLRENPVFKGVLRPEFLN